MVIQRNHKRDPSVVHTPDSKTNEYWNIDGAIITLRVWQVVLLLLYSIILSSNMRLRGFMISNCCLLIWLYHLRQLRVRLDDTNNLVIVILLLTDMQTLQIPVQCFLNSLRSLLYPA